MLTIMMKKVESIFPARKSQAVAGEAAILLRVPFSISSSVPLPMVSIVAKRNCIPMKLVM